MCFVDLNKRRTGKNSTKPRTLGLFGHSKNVVSPLYHKPRQNLSASERKFVWKHIFCYHLSHDLPFHKAISYIFSNMTHVT